MARKFWSWLVGSPQTASPRVVYEIALDSRRFRIEAPDVATLVDVLTLLDRYTGELSPGVVLTLPAGAEFTQSQLTQVP